MTDVTIRRRELFAPAEIRSLYQLHSRFFLNASWESFAADFAEKQWVIEIQIDHTPVGFSTIAVQEMVWKSRPLVCLFSGDTIVDPAHWQANALIPAFGKFILYCNERYPDALIVWHLISKGYRTYRLLPVFFHEYFPRPGVPTPGPVQELLDHLSVSRFNGHYDGKTGIVRFDGDTDYLCDQLAEVLESRRSDPHIRFFLERNPGYRRGDELSCLTDMAKENLKPAALRMVARSRVSWVTGEHP